MPESNRISVELPAGVEQLAVNNLQEILTALRPFRPGLASDDKPSIPTIGPERSAMVAAFLTEMRAHPSFIPSDVSMAEVDKDAAAREQVLRIFSQAKELADLCEDMLHLLGGDLLVAFLAYYSTVQSSARRGAGGAETSFQALRPFIRGGRRPASATPAPAGGGSAAGGGAA